MNILLFTKNIFQKFVNYNKIKQKNARNYIKIKKFYTLIAIKLLKIINKKLKYNKTYKRRMVNGKQENQS